MVTRQWEAAKAAKEDDRILRKLTNKRQALGKELNYFIKGATLLCSLLHDVVIILSLLHELTFEGCLQSHQAAMPPLDKANLQSCHLQEIQTLCCDAR